MQITFSLPNVKRKALMFRARESDQMLTEQSRIRGVVMGTAVGDAVGLAAEGISRRRISKLFPHPWQPHFFFGHGMLSDDSEHKAKIGFATAKKTKAMGRKTTCEHLGYQFKNGGTTYYVGEDGDIDVYQGKKRILHEKDEWDWGNESARA